jgi:hypothetical protein
MFGAEQASATLKSSTLVSEPQEQRRNSDERISVNE